MSDAKRQPGDLSVEWDRGLAQLELDRRLADTPADAHVRGLFFRLAEQALAARSPALVTVWRAVSSARSRWPFNLYSARDFLREQAMAAVLLDPVEPGAALRRMWQDTPRLSPLIRADRFASYLTGREPMRALLWLERNRSLMCDYGSWWVVPSGPRSAVFHYHDEFTWLEHCHAGGIDGTLRRCGVSPVVTPRLDGPYSGRLLISWD